MGHSLLPAKNRLSQIDALRGFALFGILVVNIFVFNAPYAHYTKYYSQFEGLDKQLMDSMLFFLGGRFVFIFAFLFGYGFHLQYSKQKDNLLEFRSFWLRRMSLLLIIGIFHLVFLFFGDILIPYAILGMSLLFFVKLGNKALIISFVLIHFLPVIIFFADSWISTTSSIEAPLSMKEYSSIYLNGSLIDTIQLRLHQYWSIRNEKLFHYIPLELSLFLLGIISSRKELHKKLHNKAKVFTVFALIIVGVLFWNLKTVNALYGEIPFYFQGLIQVVFSFIGLIHGFLYIIGFWFLWKLTWINKPLKALESAGKLSLTNYIFQSIICGVLFSGYGLGLYLSLSPQELILTATLIFIFQSVFSVIWLRYYEMGPLEWLWRKASYGKVKRKQIKLKVA